METTPRQTGNQEKLDKLIQQQAIENITVGQAKQKMEQARRPFAVPLSIVRRSRPNTSMPRTRSKSARRLDFAKD
eukprot:1085148-Pyramimonas_sp.AAC.1